MILPRPSIQLDRPLRVAISGTGFVAKGIFALLSARPDNYSVTGILTRRSPDSVEGFPASVRVTHHPDELVEQSDVLIECSGKVVTAVPGITAMIQAGKPVLTLNAEFQLTLGSLFHDTGLLFESLGDQPGSLAWLGHEARMMGFKPLVFASSKKFLNLNPDAIGMKEWSRKTGFSLAATVSFTDGTKVQIEQALVANGLGVSIAQQGLCGTKADDLFTGACALARKAEECGHPIADYILHSDSSGEVFVVGTHDGPADHLRSYKLGDGPYYLLNRPYHLAYFEIPISLHMLVNDSEPLLTPGPVPVHSVAAVCKRALPRGMRLVRPIGGFDVRGETVISSKIPDHVPIGLLDGAVLKHPVEPGQMITTADVDLPYADWLVRWRGLTQ
jgi:predicted homoserine dehydrogenase-like protein